MIATVAAVAGIWTAAAIPAGVLIGRRLRHLEDQTMPSYEDTYDRIAALTAERDGAYRERAHLLAWLATHYPAVIAPAPDVDEPGWQLLYLTAPTGQLSWHIAPRDASLFAHVSRVTTTHPRAQWDGHTTEQKYDRIRQLPARAETERDSVKRVGPALPIAAERYADEQAVAALASEQQDATSAEDACRVVEVDGGPIRVRGSGEMSDESRAAIAEVIAAARRKHAAEHPEAVDGPAWAQQCSCGGQGIMHLHAEHHEPIGPVAVDPFAGRACPLCGDYVTGLCPTCAPAAVAAVARARRLADDWAVLRTYGSAAFELRAALDGPTDQAAADRAEEALRDRIAAVLRKHYLSTDREAADADGRMPCVCGDWCEPSDMDGDEYDWDSHLADALLPVVAAGHHQPTSPDRP